MFKKKQLFWLSPKSCRQYRSQIKIVTTDVHYGSLADGEKVLGLLGSRCELKGKKILEVGCGWAENCIALAKWGAECTGIDIAPYNIKEARKLATAEKVNVRLLVSNAVNLRELPDNYFDTVISSYTLGFVGDIQAAFRAINRVLKKNGKFIFCLRHPAQIPGKVNRFFFPEQPPNEQWVENNYTINQIVIYLTKFGFYVHDIVPQRTKNPSKLTIPRMEKFPYRLTGKLDPKFDCLSRLPHTIIYCCRKIKSFKPRKKPTKLQSVSPAKKATRKRRLVAA